jgi:16S rRNA (guanine527-N7)-methyltransferase
MTRLSRQSDAKKTFIAGCDELGVPIRAGAADDMMRYLDVLRAWNSRVNLTAITEPSEIVVTHFLDSLTVFKVIQPGLGFRILDVGTGAGFPGLVLRVIDPSLELTLLDRNPKKIVFLKHLAQVLGLDRIIFRNAPLQDVLGSGTLSEFDLVVSRAFSSDPVVWNSLSILLKSRGYLIRMAGPAALAEDMQLTDFQVSCLWEGNLPSSDKFRRVVLYQRLE